MSQNMLDSERVTEQVTYCWLVKETCDIVLDSSHTEREKERGKGVLIGLNGVLPLLIGLNGVLPLLIGLNGMLTVLTGFGVALSTPLESSSRPNKRKCDSQTCSQHQRVEYST